MGGNCSFFNDGVGGRGMTVEITPHRRRMSPDGAGNGERGTESGYRFGGVALSLVPQNDGDPLYPLERVSGVGKDVVNLLAV